MNALEKLLSRKEIKIEGYEENSVCGHCGRELRHGIKVSNGLIVGASCLANKIAGKKVKASGEEYSVSPSRIIDMAKVCQFVDPSKWSMYGVNQSAITFIEK